MRFDWNEFCVNAFWLKRVLFKCVSTETIFCVIQYHALQTYSTQGSDWCVTKEMECKIDICVSVDEKIDKKNEWMDCRDQLKHHRRNQPISSVILAHAVTSLRLCISNSNGNRGGQFGAMPQGPEEGAMPPCEKQLWAKLCCIWLFT